jgi:hypothetical protein
VQHEAHISVRRGTVSTKLGRTVAAVKRRAYLLDIKIKTLREVRRAKQRTAAAPPSL